MLQSSETEEETEVEPEPAKPDPPKEEGVLDLDLVWFSVCFSFFVLLCSINMINIRVFLRGFLFFNFVVVGEYPSCKLYD